MTKEEENHLLHKHLELLAPALNVVKMNEGWKLINALNEQLKDTPFMFWLFGDGPGIMLREQFVHLHKIMFDRSYKDYSI